MNYTIEISIEEMMSMFSMLNDRLRLAEEMYQISVRHGGYGAEFWKRDIENCNNLHHKLIKA